MFSRIQAKHFRCLKSIDQRLGRFQALVGPNASCKTTVMDLFVSLSDIMRCRGEVGRAIGERSADFSRLLWKGEGSSFQIAVEAIIPEEVRLLMDGEKRKFQVARYEVEIGLDIESNQIGFNHESLWLLIESHPPNPQRTLFPEYRPEAKSILLSQGRDRKIVINKIPNGNDNFYTEGPNTYRPSFRLGRTRSALANVPADDTNFPLSLWFRDQLENGIQHVILDSRMIRQPSPPGLGLRFRTDGANLPWVIHELSKDKPRFDDWLDHVRTALGDVQEIRTVEREEDKHRYLVVEYANGAVVPSWLVSDGTLRMLALTIPAYLKDMRGVFLIEEPENGVHPQAMETVVQSLSSIRQGQVLIATHSPIVINQIEPRQVLCLAKDPSGATDIVSGDRHPRLKEWKAGNPDLGTLFASGILS